MLSKIVISFIRIYQNTLAEVVHRCCRYYPSCSEYTINAIEKFGVFKGFFMGFCRILRCNPFSSGGYDPVNN